MCPETVQQVLAQECNLRSNTDIARRSRGCCRACTPSDSRAWLLEVPQRIELCVGELRKLGHSSAYQSAIADDCCKPCADKRTGDARRSGAFPPAITAVP